MRGRIPTHTPDDDFNVVFGVILILAIIFATWKALA
jgi:hypothetical protein